LFLDLSFLQSVWYIVSTYVINDYHNERWIPVSSEVHSIQLYVINCGSGVFSALWYLAFFWYELVVLLLGEMSNVDSLDTMRDVLFLVTSIHLKLTSRENKPISCNLLHKVESSAPQKKQESTFHYDRHLLHR
jgi:hypothetical protein